MYDFLRHLLAVTASAGSASPAVLLHVRLPLGLTYQLKGVKHRSDEDCRQRPRRLRKAQLFSLNDRCSAKLIMGSPIGGAGVCGWSCMCRAKRKINTINLRALRPMSDMLEVRQCPHA
ncbi:hypothetical protein JIR23_07025 [Bradyrhizobium diazoefficiens]|nr:hypothetical protein [Bradyrhizobium diazoefficiens]QQN65484.1 hypothetical protein JIR23_07025 [Bradyrhizobium diazoefficiens]